MADELEKTCKNCKYDDEDIEGTHCRHCIHNATEKFEPKEVELTEEEIRIKAMNEFCEKLFNACGEEAMTVVFENRVKADVLTLDGIVEIEFEIAEQMKGEQNERLQ